jgi:hypothetical protein
VAFAHELPERKPVLEMTSIARGDGLLAADTRALK